MANKQPRKTYVSADRSLVFPNREQGNPFRDQEYMDYVESFLINDGDVHNYNNNNWGKQVENKNSGEKF